MSGGKRTALFVILATALGRGQLTIENPKHIDFPEQRARILFISTERVTEAEFHSPGAVENRLRMKLVLGEPQERFTIDDPMGNGSLYLTSWNEGKFALATMRMAIQHLLVPDREERMLHEIVRRTEEVAPVPAAQLVNQQFPSPSVAVRNDCIGGITNAAVRGGPCLPNQRTDPRPMQPR